MEVNSEDSDMAESRVLIIMTGGTICMDYAKDVGYVPVSLTWRRGRINNKCSI